MRFWRADSPLQRNGNGPIARVGRRRSATAALRQEPLPHWQHLLKADHEPNEAAGSLSRDTVAQSAGSSSHGAAGQDGQRGRQETESGSAADNRPDDGAEGAPGTVGQGAQGANVSWFSVGSDLVSPELVLGGYAVQNSVPLATQWLHRQIQGQIKKPQAIFSVATGLVPIRLVSGGS